MLGAKLYIRDHCEKDSNGLVLMTPQYLRQICKENRGYVTAALNDILYLHYKGFGSIAGLEEYTGVKSLWLEYNAIEKIEGLDHCTDLRCLYLHVNCIKEISGLSKLHKLATLNLSQNYLYTLESSENDPGLAECLELSTLLLAKNKLTNAEDIQVLSQLKKLSNLDLSQNLLEEPEIINVLEQLPELAVLNLMGNPFVTKVPNYRKTVLSRIPTLVHLDERIVSDRERALVDAWARGGLEAERTERKRLALESSNRHKKDLEAFRALQQKAGGGSTTELNPKYADKRLQELHDEMLSVIDDDKTVVDHLEPAGEGISDTSEPFLDGSIDLLNVSDAEEIRRENTGNMYK